MSLGTRDLDLKTAGMLILQCGKLEPHEVLYEKETFPMILFSSREFVESGADVVKMLEGPDGLEVYRVNSSNDYLNEAAAFEWRSIPPNTQRTVPGNVDLTLRGDTGRLSVRINSVKRLAFEFQYAGD